MNNKNTNRNHFELFFQNISSSIDILIDNLDEEKFNFSINYLNENQQKLIDTVTLKLIELKNIIDSKENRNLYYKDQKLIDEYLKNKEFINKCLKNKNLINKSLYNKTNNSSIKLNTTKKSKIIINRFNIKKVNPDGTCLYHSIMESMKIMNIDIKEKINNLNLKNIKINENTKLDGFFLREVLVEYLKNIPDKYLTENANKLLNLNIESQIEKMNINSAIQSQNLLLNSKYYNKNKKLLIIPIKNRINKLKEKIKDNSNWGSEEDLILISFILKICIFVYDYGVNRKVWKKYKNNTYIEKCDSNNSIFIVYNGINHYDSLQPKNKNEVKNILLKIN